MHTRNLKLVVIVVIAVAVLGLGMHSFARASEGSSVSQMTGEDVAAALETDSFVDIEMLSATEGWAITLRGLVLRYDGISWRVVARITEPGMDVSLFDLDMVSPTSGWIIGSGDLLARDTGSATLSWKFDGVDWKRIPVPLSNIYDSTTNLVDIDMIDDTDGWISAEQSLLRYNGVAWESVLTPDDLNVPCDPSTPCQKSFERVDAIDENNVLVVVNIWTSEYSSCSPNDYCHFYFRFDGEKWIYLGENTGAVSPQTNYDNGYAGPTDGWVAEKHLYPIDNDTGINDDYYNYSSNILLKRLEGTDWITTSLGFTGTIFHLVTDPTGDLPLMIWGIKRLLSRR